MFGFVTFSLSEQASGSLERELFSYFLCEQSGHNPASPCSRSGFEDLTNPAVTIISLLLAMLAPLVNFVFVVDCNEFKQKLRTLCSKA